jgi:hypothetical protein
MSTKVNWLVDDYILDSRHTVGDLKKSILDAGHDLYTTKYMPLSEYQDYGPKDWVNEPTVMYGTIGYIQRCKVPFIPGAYGINQNTDCNFYYPELPKLWMLNNGFVMVPFGIFQNNPWCYFDMFGEDALFMRPNSGRKTFAGTVVTKENVVSELSSSMQITSVTKETIILLSPAKVIEGEFRFVIGNREVIDGSEYRWDNKLDVRRDYPKECWELADKMARWGWQPDICYTVDVALTPVGPKIIELNGFSCAGLYACDKDIIVNRISEIALKDFKGEL